MDGEIITYAFIFWIINLFFTNRDLKKELAAVKQRLANAEDHLEHCKGSEDQVTVEMDAALNFVIRLNDVTVSTNPFESFTEADIRANQLRKKIAAGESISIIFKWEE